MTTQTTQTTQTTLEKKIHDLWDYYDEVVRDAGPYGFQCSITQATLAGIKVEIAKLEETR